MIKNLKKENQKLNDINEQLVEKNKINKIDINRKENIIKY